MIVKICGVTRPADADAAVRAGADWLGLNFWPKSKRSIDAARGREVAAAARAAGPVRLVGVFVDAELGEMQALAGEVGLDYVQLHGDEPASVGAALGERAIKALGLGGAADVARLAEYPGDLVLVDTPTEGYGGSGRTFDWSLARAAVATGKRVLLAGGLTPGNVGAAIAAVHPYGVDVASGVESAPGIKDHELVRRFVRAAKGLS